MPAYRGYTCNKCGKAFSHNCGENYLYKLGSRKFCSYSCWRAAGGGGGCKKRPGRKRQPARSVVND
jgi:hypothetical protein